MQVLNTWDENRASTLRYLSQRHREMLQARYRQEWKVFYTTASLLILAVVSKFKFAQLWNNVDPYLAATGLTILIAAAIFSLYRLHMGNATHKKIAEATENAMVHSAKADEMNVSDLVKWADARRAEFGRKNIKVSSYIALGWQSFTLLLILAFCISRVCK